MLTAANYHPPTTPLEKLLGDYDLRIVHPENKLSGLWEIKKQNGFVVAAFWLFEGEFCYQLGAGKVKTSEASDWREVALYCIQQYVGDGRAAV